ncbi:hypothetical protein [Catenovulum adriaticum]|uniref:Uncharacterized protein n=1 Tax=Catenovulum adriaticum TaxID=2984846 RepID=A0ABY7AUS4_9ALTE|nr:hypothetical protein [Catenovulum sp. TS8]WAJ72265.1 hypothetical protein OLW01_16110 [Catenovulum sp. TS8]
MVLPSGGIKNNNLSIARYSLADSLAALTQPMSKIWLKLNHHLCATTSSINCLSGTQKTLMSAQPLFQKQQYKKTTHYPNLASQFKQIMQAINSTNKL